MKRSISFAMVITVSLTMLAAASSADDPKEEAIQKDLKQLEGKWRVTSLVHNGEKAKKEDARKLTVVNDADGKWSIQSEGTQISKGTNTLDPTTKPKSIDFEITEGEAKGSKYVGIYELSEKSRKLCFVPAGKERPTEFTSSPGSERILIAFERLRDGE
jgi:uncharacterized protein (TIGR03067 family)